MATVREDLQDQIIAIRETVVDGWKDFKSFMQETWPCADHFAADSDRCVVGG